MVRPFATIILQLPDKDIDQYMEEVEGKLIEETDYDLELRRSIEISEACKHIPNLVFTKYYPEFSAKKILTMDWLEGRHLREFLETNPSPEIRNQIGQTLWDFYDHQMHTLRAVHADPHPGNFLMRGDGTLGVIDFGCIKDVPDDFYETYFWVLSPHLFEDEEQLEKLLTKMDFLYDDDPAHLRVFYKDLFKYMIELLTRPFGQDVFDFSDDAYFTQIYEFGESLSKMKEVRESKKARGSRHSLYINRTYFGLYSLLNELKATVKISRPEKFMKPLEII